MTLYETECYICMGHEKYHHICMNWPGQVQPMSKIYGLIITSKTIYSKEIIGNLYMDDIWYGPINIFLLWNIKNNVIFEW